MHDVTLLAYIVVVLVITMWPSPPDPGRLRPLQRLLAWAHDVGLPAGFDLAALEFTANVAMFVPLGLLLATSRRMRSPWLAAVAGLVLSAAIETVQLAVPGRYSTAADVVANTAGASMAAAAVVAHRAWRARRDQHTRRTGGAPARITRPDADVTRSNPHRQAPSGRP